MANVVCSDCLNNSINDYVGHEVCNECRVKVSELKLQQLAYDTENKILSAKSNLKKLNIEVNDSNLQAAYDYSDLALKSLKRSMC
jgi:hypothetical protein